jgi:oligopeptidase B
MKTLESKTSMDNWEDALAHRKMEDIDLFRDFWSCASALSKTELYLGMERRVLFLETYTAHATSNVDFDTDILRYAYQSMATPDY